MVDEYVASNTNMGEKSRGWDELVPECTADGPTIDMNDVEPSTSDGTDTIMPASGITFRRPTVSPSSLKEVTVPVARRCRGRPKGTDKSLNVKYGSAKPQRKRTAKCLNQGIPTGTTTPTSDNYAECGLIEPPVAPGHAKKRRQAVKWVQCDKLAICVDKVVIKVNAISYQHNDETTEL